MNYPISCSIPATRSIREGGPRQLSTSPRSTLHTGWLFLTMAHRCSWRRRRVSNHHIITGWSLGEVVDLAHLRLDAVLNVDRRN